MSGTERAPEARADAAAPARAAEGAGGKGRLVPVKARLAAVSYDAALPDDVRNLYDRALAAFIAKVMDFNAEWAATALAYIVVNGSKVLVDGSDHDVIAAAARAGWDIYDFGVRSVYVYETDTINGIVRLATPNDAFTIRVWINVSKSIKEKGKFVAYNAAKTAILNIINKMKG